MNMSEMGTFCQISNIKWQHLEISLDYPCGFEESFPFVVSLLHFVNVHPSTWHLFWSVCQREMHMFEKMQNYEKLA